MKIAVVASTIAVDCVELKNKILHYLKQKDIETIDGGPFGTEKPVNPLQYVENTARMIPSKQIDKAISICKMGVSVARASINAGIDPDEIAQQNVTAPNSLKNYKILTLGTRFTWEETKIYIDNFIESTTLKYN